MADPDAGFRAFATDSAVVDQGQPDPAFWGDDGRPPRRERHSRRGLFDRVGWSQRDRRAAAVILVALGLGITLLAVRAGTPGPSPRPRASTAAPGFAARVVVDVSGAVIRPGVVDLPAGSRVVDALDAAGGALADADLDRMNLAAPLRDGQRIVVRRGTAPSTSTPTTSTEAPTSTTTVPR